jgi:hypothetical protein
VSNLVQYKKSLEIKHRLLDKQIEQAYINRIDDTTVKNMKTEKLILKEKIADLERKLTENTDAI